MKKTIVTFLLLVLLKVVSAQDTDLWAISERGGLNAHGMLLRFHPTDSGNVTPVLSFDTVRASIRDTSTYRFVDSSVNYFIDERRFDPIYKNGSIYGIASSTDSFASFIYRFNINTMKYERLSGFPISWGLIRSSTLMFASDGKLYASSTKGGAFNQGFIYRFDPEVNIIEKLHDFDSTFNRGQQVAPFVQVGTNLFAQSTIGGVNGKGFLFKLDISNNSFSVLHSFDFQPKENSQLFVNELGEIFGALKGGAYGFGQIFLFKTLTNEFQVINNFDEQLQNPNIAIQGPVFTAADKHTIYGVSGGGQTCITGGNPTGAKCGTLFKYDLISNSVKVLLYTNYGGDPNSFKGLVAHSMTLASNNALYGWGGSMQSFSLIDSTFEGLFRETEYPIDGYPISYNTTPLDTNSITSILSSIENITKGLNALDVRVYPVPFSDKVSIQHNNKESVNGVITDAIGRIVWQSKSVKNEDAINTVSWSSGIYFFNFENASAKSFIGKIVKQ